ncbi:MAG: TetR/AcrR family transcriptional regulator [Deltaproteobacteria bacterium]|nr:TetR/AcrR family transcriptional regulator [Deltaproteobacteria bacterium]
MASPPAGDTSPGKARMLAEARRLFWAQGFHGTSLRDLARAYGCQPANVYNFFPNKEAILHQVLREEMEEIVLPLAEPEDDPPDDPAEQLRRLIHHHLAVTLGHRRSAKMLFDVALDHLTPAHRAEVVALRDRYDHLVRGILRRGAARGVFAPLDPKLAGFMIANLITRCRVWYTPEGPMSVEELADFIWRFALAGLGHAPGGAPAPAGPEASGAW